MVQQGLKGARHAQNHTSNKVLLFKLAMALGKLSRHQAESDRWGTIWSVFIYSETHKTWTHQFKWPQTQSLLRNNTTEDLVGDKPNPFRQQFQHESCSTHLTIFMQQNFSCENKRLRRKIGLTSYNYANFLHQPKSPKHLQAFSSMQRHPCTRSSAQHKNAFLKHSYTRRETCVFEGVFEM